MPKPSAPTGTAPLRERLLDEFLELWSLVPPPAYLGQILDLIGYNATREDLLVTNLDFLHGWSHSTSLIS